MQNLSATLLQVCFYPYHFLNLFVYYIGINDLIFQKLNTANNANLEMKTEMTKKYDSLKAKDEEISSLTTKIKDLESLHGNSEVTTSFRIVIQYFLGQSYLSL